MRDWYAFCHFHLDYLDTTHKSFLFANIILQKGPYVGDLHYAVVLQKLLAGNSTELLRFLDFSAPVYDRYTNTCIGVITAHMKYAFPSYPRHPSSSPSIINSFLPNYSI